MILHVRNQHVFTVFVGVLSATFASADNAGDWYDNRDQNHAAINHDHHPGLEAMSSGLGFQSVLTGRDVVVGNASLAHTHSQWGSLVRVDGMDFLGATATYLQYRSNHAYWYPEHHDHDDKDHYHAMTPTVSSSQGSSASELDEVDKWFFTLAAFPSAVKERLKESGLLMPTLQMIFRRTRVASDDEYLSGAAHPSVFDNTNNQAAMIAMAEAMRVEDLPPMVQLRVLEDTYRGRRGEDFFEIGGAEVLYDVPVSIARIYRGRERTKRLVVSAAESYDPNERPLTYHWRVLRGDPAAVRVTPRNEAGSEVEIEIDYHPETTIPGSERRTNLVVVGAFVHNGVYYSAPGFVTSFTLDNEERDYDELGRIREIRYNTGYVHPVLSRPKTWERDTFVYGRSRALRGWTRHSGGETHEFTADGDLVVEGSLFGTIASVQRVRYDRDSATGMVKWSTVGSPTPFDEPATATLSIDAIRRRESRPISERVAALAAGVRAGSALSTDSFELLRSAISERAFPVDRVVAARALGRAAVTDAQRRSLLPQVRRAGAMVLPHLLGAFEPASKLDARSPDASELSTKLADALLEAPGLANVSRDRVEKLFELWGRPAGERLARILTRFGDDPAERAKRLAELDATLLGGDPVRGEAIFHGTVAACSTCHRVGGVGGEVGPNLSKIGGLRARRDLLEAVVFPSSTLVNGYESWQLVTKAGTVHAGVIRSSTNEAVEMATGPASTVRIPRSEIARLETADTSIMPKGLDEALSARQLADLIRYLQSLK